MTIVVKAGLVAAIVFVTVLAAASNREPSFSRVETYPDMGRLDYILAVADLNGDGRDDILAGGREEAAFDGQPEDRLGTSALEVFFGQEDGAFEHAFWSTERSRPGSRSPWPRTSTATSGSTWRCSTPASTSARRASATGIRRNSG